MDRVTSHGFGLQWVCLGRPEAGWTDELLTLRYNNPLVKQPKTLHANDFDVHMLLSGGKEAEFYKWMCSRTSILFCQINDLLVRRILWERISVHAVVTEGWHLLSKKGMKKQREWWISEHPLTGVWGDKVCDVPCLSSTSFDLVSLPPVSGCLGG